MGYYIDIVDCDIFLDKKHFEDVYQKMCKLNDYDELKRGGQFGGDREPVEERWNPYKWFSWMDYNYPDTCKNLNDILQQIGFEVSYDNQGNLINLGYSNKTGNEDYFLACFAGYVKDGSYIEFKGEDDSYYKYDFKDGKMNHYCGELSIEYHYEETYEFGKLSKADEASAKWVAEWRKRKEQNQIGKEESSVSS